MAKPRRTNAQIAHDALVKVLSDYFDPLVFAQTLKALDWTPQTELEKLTKIASDENQSVKDRLLAMDTIHKRLVENQELSALVNHLVNRPASPGNGRRRPAIAGGRKQPLPSQPEPDSDEPVVLQPRSSFLAGKAAQTTAAAIDALSQQINPTEKENPNDQHPRIATAGGSTPGPSGGSSREKRPVLVAAEADDPGRPRSSDGHSPAPPPGNPAEPSTPPDPPASGSQEENSSGAPTAASGGPAESSPAVNTGGPIPGTGGPVAIRPTAGTFGGGICPGD